jgi:hypothetical protein
MFTIKISIRNVLLKSCNLGGTSNVSELALYSGENLPFKLTFPPFRKFSDDSIRQSTCKVGPINEQNM